MKRGKQSTKVDLEGGWQKKQKNKSGVKKILIFTCPLDKYT